MPLTLVFSLVLFFGTTLWIFVPPLLFLITGVRWNVLEANNPAFYSSFWVVGGLLIFLVSMGSLLFGYRRLRTALENEVRLGAGLCLFFLFCAYSLQRVENELTLVGLAVPSFENALWLYWAAGIAFLGLALWPRKNEIWVLGVVFLFLAILPFYLSADLPFEHNLSDVFLDVREACRNLLHGHSPYGLEKDRTWEGGCSYFPGLWLPYFPAVVLGVDLRFFSALFNILFGLVVWRSSGKKNALLSAWLVALFLLNPWYLLRDDIYMPAYLLIWALFYSALRTGSGTMAARWYGLGLSAHPFHWVLLPFWSLWMLKSDGVKKTLARLGQALAVAFFVMIPFVLWNPAGFYRGAIAHFMGSSAVNISDFGLVAWFSHEPQWLIVLALLSLGAGAWMAWRGPGTLESLFKWLAVSLGLALLASYHIEHYYYFVPLALVLFHQITVLDPAMTREAVPLWSWEQKQPKGRRAIPKY